MHSSTWTRRHFLAQQPFGLGGLALAWLLDQDGLLAAPAKPAYTIHAGARARHVTGAIIIAC